MTKRHRDAGTGEFTTADHAAEHPDTTVSETVTSAIDAAHIERQRQWSRDTFGPDPRLAGVVDHIRKELHEIEADPTDLGEWVDVVILALDGAWRAGHEPEQIIAGIKAKQATNEARTWPDWRTTDPTKAIEHVRDDAIATALEGRDDA